MRQLYPLLALVLCGWGSCQPHGEAPIADADAACYQPCTPSLTDTGVRWDVDPEKAEAWDELGNGVVPDLAGKLLQCERRRQACAGFITDLKDRKVIRGAQQTDREP